MPTEAVSREGAHCMSDDVPLPTDDEPIIATAHRHDTYPIHVTRTLPAALDRLLETTEGARLAIITDERVDQFHGAALRAQLDERGIRYIQHALPPGERSKSTGCALELWDWLAGSQISRDDYVLNFGGGVICDLGGWVASAFMRDLHYVNLSTTLLGQVDGAMGGKVAVNHPVAKNLIGAFHQPSAVVHNVGFLETLDPRHLSAGMAECVKKAIIASPPYWHFINEHAEQLVEGDLDALEELVRAAAKIKSVLVERDPYERDLRRPLNFGHTIAHPLETVAGYQDLLHGEAVAFGMLVETRIAAARGVLAEPLVDPLVELLIRLRLPDCHDRLPIDTCIEPVLQAIAPVRRIRGGSTNIVLPKKLGVVFIVHDVQNTETACALSACGMPHTAAMANE
jgi:3-dehydroquinate synthase